MEVPRERPSQGVLTNVPRSEAAVGVRRASAALLTPQTVPCCYPAGRATSGQTAVTNDRYVLRMLASASS